MKPLTIHPGCSCLSLMKQSTLHLNSTGIDTLETNKKIFYILPPPKETPTTPSDITSITISDITTHKETPKTPSYHSVTPTIFKHTQYHQS